MPNEIKSLPDGKISAKLETGEIFEGDPLEVTTKLAESKVHTNKNYLTIKSEYEALKATPPPTKAQPTPEAQSEAQLQEYLLTQTAKALGYNNADEYKADLAKVKHTTEEVNNNLVASAFMAQCPDFPNSAESIDSLSKKIDEMKWDFTPQSMIAAHALCLREDKYKPLSVEQQNATWEQGLRASNRPTPPPMVRSQNPESVNQAKPVEQMTAAEIKALYFQQLQAQK